MLLGAYILAYQQRAGLGLRNPDMGRALHVSRSLPPIISSARLITSFDKPNCISSSAETLLKNSRHGEHPLYSSQSSNMGGSVPLSTRQSALCWKTAFRVCQNHRAGVLARRFSSESVSESEWPETINEHVVCRQSGGEDTMAPDSKQVQRTWQDVCATDSETDADTVASTLQRMGIDNEGHMQHRSQKPHHFKKEKDDDRGRLDTVDECAVGSQTHHRDTASYHRVAGHKQLRRARQAAFETESETEAETVAGTFHSTESVDDGHIQHRVHKFQRSDKKTNDDLGTGRRSHIGDALSHHQAAGHEQLQRARRSNYETETETDAETAASSYRRQKSYHSKEQTDAEVGSTMSDQHKAEHTSVEEALAQGGSESEVEAGLSDWSETDVDEQVQQQWQAIYDSGGDIEDANAGSQSVITSRDLSHLKTSPADKFRGARAPSRPSKKERSAGLSPRLLRDDDSDDVEIESDLEGELQDEIERQMAAEPKFQRPSVTWGILLTKDLRWQAREKVLVYLETEGIDTTELRRIELPTTVEVMQTRLGFLRKIGLDDDTINNYPLVLGCSVYKNMVPVLKYLKKLGFPQPWVPILLKKYPMILHASVIIDILPVIYFLRGLDIDAIDLPRVITKYPDVLGFKTEGTMSTSVAYLVSMGVNMRHVGYMLTEYPEILGMRAASIIKPKFEYLMSLGIPQMIVAKILERRPSVLGYHLENRMQFNVSQLLEIGVRKEAIPGMVAQFPELLGRVFGDSVKDYVSWCKGHLELDSDNAARMIEKMPQVMFIRTAIALERISFLKSERFTVAEIGLMVTQCPQILVLSIYDYLRPSLKFLNKEMGRSHADVLGFPAFLTYSLHGRIKPRFKTLAGTNEHCSLDWLLNCSDLEFQKRLKAGFATNEPVGTKFVMGGLLPKKPVVDEDEFQAVEQSKVAVM